MLWEIELPDQRGGSNRTYVRYNGGTGRCENSPGPGHPRVSGGSMSYHTCTIDGCENRLRSRLWCAKHYGRYLRAGDPLKLLGPPPPSDPAERFWPKVSVDSSGCWLWAAALDPNGYGRFQLGQPVGTVLAHRYAYELKRGKIADGLTIDHLCRVHNCVNPEHLEPVTMGVNVLRGDAPSAINARKTKCMRGHAFDETNTYLTSQGKRQCKTCNRHRDAARKAKQYEQALR